MLHIDGDIIAYRIACAVEEDATEGQVKGLCDSFVSLRCLVPFPELTPYQIYLTDSPDTDNFRHTVAVTAKYKGFRSNKPPMLPVVRQHLMDYWDAIIARRGTEADDAIAINATLDLLADESPVILSLDKDFDQVPCERYNFVTGESTHPDPWEAMKNLYKQIIIGDVCDNIIGVDGIGPGAADVLIDNCATELDMWLVCVDQLGYDRAVENGQLVYLLRHDFDYFTVAAEAEEIDRDYAWNTVESIKGNVVEALSGGRESGTDTVPVCLGASEERA